MKPTLITQCYQACVETIDAMRGFVSVHLLRNRARARASRLSDLVKKTHTHLFRLFIPAAYAEVRILSDERRGRGSFYSLHGDQPRYDQ